ncbi:MAG: GDP-mannose 4,6-dehydratase [Gordonia paraffinivorans]
MGDRAVVTGGAGFLGTHLCLRLVEFGHDVVCIDDLSTGAPMNVAGLEAAGVTVVRHDVVDPLPVAGPVSLVAHLACPPSPTYYLRHGIDTLRCAADGTRHALELAGDRGARCVIASTSEIYGDPLEHPQTELYRGNVDPTGPRSVYDEGKRYAEALAVAHHRERGTDVGIARIFNTYGPRMRADDGRMIPTFIAQALAGDPLTVSGDGQQTRSLCYVDDLVDGLMALADSSVGVPVNLGNPVEMTVREVAEAVCDAVGVPVDLVHGPAAPDDPVRRRPDIGRADTLLGWRPRVGLVDGLARTVAWFAGQPGRVSPPSGASTSPV